MSQILIKLGDLEAIVAAAVGDLPPEPGELHCSNRFQGASTAAAIH